MEDRILEITNQMFDEAKAQRPPEDAAAEPVDIYQRNQDRIREANQKSYPRGSSAIVNTAVYSVIDGAGGEGLAHAYKKAKEEVETLKDMDERGRADLRRQQYMQEYFLPAVELVVNSASPDEVLNSKQALADLDKYALLEGSGKGYTASYIRQAYGNQLGQISGKDDQNVRSAIRRLNMLLDNGEIRSAVGLANRLKKKIDNGEALSSDESYELLGRITSFYS